MSFVTTQPEMLATLQSMSNAWSGHDGAWRSNYPWEIR
jgi:hypothetical protein